ncbi:MAG: glycosyltransferase [Bryobacter sp.]|nr:glycosyltransferase [Bryobacter sp.]
MRILIATVGSFGDLHPYLAIALEARDRGHEVTLATHAYYRAKVESEGLRFVAIPPNLEGFETDEAARRRAMHPLDGTRYVIQEIFLPPLAEAYQILLAEAAFADVVLGSTFALGAPLAALKLGKPWLTSYLQPAALFSIHDPPQVPAMPILPWLRRFGTKPVAIMKDVANRGNRYFLKPLYALAAREGIAESAIPDLFGGASPHGNLILFSHHFQAPQPDFPAPFVQCGFPFYDKLDGAQSGLSDALKTFLAEGPAPVLFTLGTSAVMDPGRFYENAVEACGALGLRAILLVSRLHIERLAALNSAKVKVVDYAPHSLLMPRARATVHQGGIGTTAQALRSGKPMVVVPFSHDQPDNAMRVERLGVGLQLSKGKLNARNLRDTLARLGEGDFASRAAALGQAIRAENGALTAVLALEALHAQTK